MIKIYLALKAIFFDSVANTLLIFALLNIVK